MAPAAAQEIFSGNGQPQANPQAQGNPDCPPPVINGITPKNWSCKTGTQGVQGNPYCPPPVIMINGQPTTPRNWSCPGGTPAARNAPSGPNGPWDPEHPGFPTVAGSTPCQPGGPGGYNWLDNPEGTRLPPGCVRPTRRIITNRDRVYEPAAPGSYIVPPAGPPGSYIQPEGGPGSYIVPPPGPPGSYIQSDRPENYTRSTGGRGASGTQVHRGPGGAILLSPGKTQPAGAKNAQGGSSYRQDSGAMRNGVVSNGGATQYRQDTGAMQGVISGGQPARTQAGASGATAAHPATANQSSAAAQAAARAQAAKVMNGVIKMLGTEP
ncbi:MAG: hypothetical protein ACXWLJ_08840 [Rhizomicrobium sp.]